MAGDMKYFQISEDDLATLERELPRLAERLLLHLDNKTKVKIRTIQKVLTNVRWNYGPPLEVEKVDDQ